METPLSLDAENVLSGRANCIGTDLVEQLTQYPLDCVDTEFPHFARSIDSPDSIERPKESHPVFYGCYDWHSSVHSHWCLVRLLRVVDDHPAKSEIVDSIASRFTDEKVETEREFFETNESFEKPYGWAWLLRLISELHLWEDERAENWLDTLKPLERRIVDLVEAEFLTEKRPFRVATHRNSAFALLNVLDYASVASNEALESSASETAMRFYRDDHEYPVEYEPLGWDFLSPSMTEADLMRRVLPRDEFVPWLKAFLPDVTKSPYDAILDPVEEVPDGGVGLHLVGLDLSKAWSMAGIASALDDHPLAERLEASAERHARVGLERTFTDDYAGTHWLSSFAVYLFTRNEGGIAPE